MICYFDGLCEPRNPGGHGCAGFIVEPHPALPGLVAGNLYLGQGSDMTNNVAEYRALLLVLKTLWRGGWRGPVIARGDSKLVVCQSRGEWACNAERIRPLLFRVRKAREQFAYITFEWIPREKNQAADHQSRLAYQEVTGSMPPERTKVKKY